MSSVDIAKRLNINRATVSELTKRHSLPVKHLGYHNTRYDLNAIKRCLYNASQPNQHNKRWLETSIAPTYDKEWNLPWDEFIVASDTHSPCVNERMFNRMLEVAQKRGIKNFLHAGDFFDGDTFSYWPGMTDDAVDFDYEIEYSAKIVKSLLEVFSNVYFIMGTHDLRFYRMLKGMGKGVQFDTPFRLLKEYYKKIKVSRYHHCNIGKEWHVTHPKNTIQVNYVPAIRMGARYERSMVYAHGHWLSMGKDPSATHWHIACGGLMDSKKIAYKSLIDTSHSEWVPGFLAVVDKTKPILFSEDSPWEIYLH